MKTKLHSPYLARDKKNKDTARWVTDNIKEIINTPAIPGLKEITIQEQGGDVDTEGLVLAFRGTRSRLFICGFADNRENGFITDPQDADIYGIEVTDGEDSSGGFNGSNETVGAAYGVVCARLRREGFRVVPSLKAYF